MIHVVVAVIAALITIKLQIPKHHNLQYIQTSWTCITQWKQSHRISHLSKNIDTEQIFVSCFGCRNGPNAA